MNTLFADYTKLQLSPDDAAREMLKGRLNQAIVSAVGKRKVLEKPIEALRDAASATSCGEATAKPKKLPLERWITRACQDRKSAKKQWSTCLRRG